MRRFKHFFCIIALIVTLCSCSFVGETDFPMFEKRFNDSNKSFQIDEKSYTKEVLEKSNKYCCYFDAKAGGKYLISIYENKDVSVISSCTLCISSSLELDIEVVKELFCTMLYAFNQTDEEKALEVFEKLGLDNKNAYTTIGTTTEKLEGFNVDVIVNGAGTAITVY